MLFAVVNHEYECFSGWLIEVLGHGDGSERGPPLFDPFVMFKPLILQTRDELSNVKMRFMIRDRFLWIRFVSLGLALKLGGPTLDENALRPYRNKPTVTGTLKWVMKVFGDAVHLPDKLTLSGSNAALSLKPGRHEELAQAMHFGLL